MNAILDGEIVSSAAMPELPMGAPGVFETLLWQRGELVFSAPHWTRFEAGCRWHGFLPPVPRANFEHHVRELVQQNQIACGVVRLAAWQLAPGRVTWRIDVGPPRPHMARGEFAVGWGDVLPAADETRAFKHLNRTIWSQSLRRARGAGFDEALLTDARGRVVEGCVSNVFVVCGTTLLTPALEDGPLPGIMRAEVIGFARRAGWDFCERSITIAEVESAAEVWLTNSLIGIRPVSQLAGKSLPADRPVLDRFAGLWQRAFGWSPIVVPESPVR